MSSLPRRALGRGLEALLPQLPQTGAPTLGQPSLRRDYFLCPVEEIHPAPDQPRRHFDETALEELAQTIRQHGVVQPLLVRREPGRDGFLLVAGERRWRAAQRAGLREVPVVVKETSDESAFEIALVENLQRQDLDPIEEAQAFHRLADEYRLSQDEIATRVGKDRSTVANAIRLLALPPRVRDQVIAGSLSAGHARALLSLSADGEAGSLGTNSAIERTARHVVARGLSVRQTEALVRRLRRTPTERANGDSPSANVRDLESRLRARLGTRVRILDKKGAGRVEIDYSSLDELDRLLGVLLA